MLFIFGYLASFCLIGICPNNDTRGRLMENFSEWATKLEIECFDKINNLTMWQSTMIDVFVLWILFIRAFPLI